MERYFVCGRCAHQWNAPEYPVACENCDALTLVECDTPEDQDELSEQVLEERTAKRS